MTPPVRKYDLPTRPPAANEPARRPAEGAGAGAGKNVDAKELALDLTQMALDITGIFEPTPISDASNTAISLFRGKWGDAGISALGMLPYVGDAAKLGKLGKWAENIVNGVELALKNSDFAKTAGPTLKKIADAIDAAPASIFNKLPAGAQEKLLEMRGTLAKLPGAGGEGAAGSISHKANAWSDYKDRGGDWNFERWSKNYEGNMTRAADSNKAVDDLWKAQGQWGKKEASVDVRMPDGSVYQRRLDIGNADPDVLRGLEHKSGYAYLSQENAWEVARDAELVKQGWNIEWVVDGSASKPLVEALQQNGIKVIVNGEVL